MPLIAHYKCNGDPNDASGNGNHGTATGGVWIAGKIGGAFDAQGSSEITVPTFWIGNEFTLSWWMNPATWTGTSARYVLAQYLTTGNHRQWGLVYNGTAAEYQIYTSDNGIRYATASLGFGPATGWKQFAVTCNNTTRIWRVHVNGVFIIEVTAAYTFADQGAPLTIAGRGGTGYFDAAFDDVRIDNGILPLWKIKAIYNGGKGSEECEPWQRLIRPVIRRTIQPLIGAA